MAAKFWLDPVALERPGDSTELSSTRLRSSHKSIARNYWRGGMNSSAVETLEARARKVTVTEEALTADLWTDGRLSFLCSGILGCGMARLRSATTSRSSEMGHTSTGRIWTRTWKWLVFWPVAAPERVLNP